ncbi:MAG: FHA domain-containing protein, partial [Heliobacteriaceae bacterium]|nr:FHA domain-containing protein [Heliobacteriaceae bacterium]
ETLRLLKIASEGKLTKLQDGKTVSVSFEDVFKERQSEFITANAISVSGIKNAAAPKETTAFDAEKVAKIANKAETIAAMDTAKDYISVCWEELNSGLNSNDNKQLSTAIHDTLNKLSQMSGKTLSLPDGYKINNGVIVDAQGNAVSVDKLKELAAQLKTGLSDISKDLLGKEIPQNASNKDVSALLEDGYQSKLESFKAEYREAFGQEVPDKMIESYISTIDNGKMVVNFGVIVGAVIAAPFTGGGSLAVFAAGAGASMTLNAAEKSTDADGYTNSEWTSDATQAMWDGALSTVGVKVGMFANQAAKGGFKMASSVIKAAQKVPGMTPQTLEKIAVGAAKMEAAGGKVAQKVIQANKSRIGKMAPNIKPETLEKAAVWLSRAEAAGMEITSDSLQSVVYSYCTEGEFNEEIFVRGLIMSAAGNTAGHIYGARTDLKSSGNAKPVNNNRPSMDKPKYVIPENESVLAKATRDGNNSQAVAPQRTVGKLNNEKFAQVQKEVDELLSNAKSAADLETLEKQIAALQDRSQRRLLEGKLNAKKAELSKPSAPEVKSEAKVEEAKIKADDVVETPKKNELIDEAKPVEKSNSETPVQNPPAKPASAAVKSKYFSDNDVVSFANEHAMSDAYTHREALLQQGWKRTEADSRNFISVEKDGVLLTYIYDTKTARLMSKSKCLIDIEPNGNYNRKSDIRVEYAADGSRSVKISENGAEIPVNPSALKAEESAAVIQEKSPAAEGAPANGKPVEIPQHNAPEVQHLPNGDTVELTRGADGEIVRRATIRKDGKVTIEENGQIRELDKKGRVIKETKVNADGSQDIITYSYNMFGKQKLASKTRIDAPAGKNKPPVVDIPANPASKLAKSTPVTVANDAVLVLNPGAKQVEIPMSHPKIAAMKDGDMISIGRLKDNNIQINDRYISAQHLVIEKVNGKYVVTDHSINGTKVVSTKGRVANSTPVNDKFKHLNSAENKGKFFYDLYEQNYRDLRLGRYSPEASVKGVPQETINKINAKGRYGGKDYDWMVHDFGKKTNSSGSNIDRVSLNVVADEKMIDELSLLLREGVYTNSSGQKIKLNQNELSSGYFKTPPDVKGWCTRHDPITMYFYGNVSDSMLNALAEVTAKYKRQSTKPLMNALEGKPWIAHEYNPTPQEAHALYQRALKLDKELADMIHFEFNQNKNNPWNTSTGMMASMKQLIDEYEIFLASIRR